MVFVVRIKDQMFSSQSWICEGIAKCVQRGCPTQQRMEEAFGATKDKILEVLQNRVFCPSGGGNLESYYYHFGNLTEEGFQKIYDRVVWNNKSGFIKEELVQLSRIYPTEKGVSVEGVALFDFSEKIAENPIVIENIDTVILQDSVVESFWTRSHVIGAIALGVLAIGLARAYFARPVEKAEK